MNTSEVMNIIGNVEGETCILIDDMIDTAGTICHAADALAEAGAADLCKLYAPCITSGQPWTIFEISN